MTLLDSKVCPKCESQMVYGRMGAKDDSSNRYWVALKEIRLFRKPSLTDNGKRIPARAYRCQQCGYVEIYVSDEGIT